MYQPGDKLKRIRRNYNNGPQLGETATVKTYMPEPKGRLTIILTEERYSGWSYDDNEFEFIEHAKPIEYKKATWKVPRDAR